MRLNQLGIALLVVVSAAPALADPNPAPTNLSIWVVGADVRLNWYAPDPGSGNTRIKLVRRLNAPPTGPDGPGAEVLLEGAATQYVDPIVGLMPDLPSAPHVYHYAVYGCDASGTVCESAGSHAAVAPSLVQCLRGGGYTIFWRHADADICSDRTDLGTAHNTTAPNWWRSCDSNCPTATARQLNATGEQRATFIGDQIRALEIPVGRVVSSEYCRCLGTAERMAFGVTTESDTGITYFVYDESNRCTHSYERIREVPPPATNTAIIGHAGFSPTCPTLSVLQWSECAIFKPDDAGGATLIDQLSWNEWGDLTTDVKPISSLGGGVTLDVLREDADGVRIRYRIATGDAVPVRIQIFDVLGRRLWTARPGEQDRGEYELTWDRRDEEGHTVRAGIYLVRLEAGSLARSRKVVVLGR